MNNIYIILLRYHYLTELNDKELGGVYDGETHVLDYKQMKQSNRYANKLRRKLNIPSELYRTKENQILSRMSFEKLEAEYNRLELKEPKEIEIYKIEVIR